MLSVNDMLSHNKREFRDICHIMLAAALANGRDMKSLTSLKPGPWRDYLNMLIACK
jgi:hypothetical protein